jgi:hypothetical protein
MKKNTSPAMSAHDFDALAAALEKVAAFAPGQPGYGHWASISRDGAAAARVQDLDAVKAACRGCHDQDKDRYRGRPRGRRRRARRAARRRASRARARSARRSRIRRRRRATAGRTRADRGAWRRADRRAAAASRRPRPRRRRPGGTRGRGRRVASRWNGGPGPELAEATAPPPAGFAPVAIARAPDRARIAPIAIGIVPAREQPASIAFETLPIAIERLPTAIEPLPIAIEPLPIAIETLPIAIETIATAIETIFLAIEIISARDPIVPIADPIIPIAIETISPRAAAVFGPHGTIRCRGAPAARPGRRLARRRDRRPRGERRTPIAAAATNIGQRWRKDAVTGDARTLAPSNDPGAGP